MLEFKKVVLALPLIFCFSCGGGETNPPIDDRDIPNFAGIYSANFLPHTLRCSSGYTEERPQASGLYAVVQDGGAINIFFGTDNSYEGSVSSDGRFRGVASVDSIVEGNFNITYRYTLSGTFTETGWSGGFSSRGTVIGNPSTCTAETTFEGDLEG